MIIDRLILKNFKRFKNVDIRFSDGITGILGNNGTGKSSLVQAIFFALYGVQATGISPDYIVSSFADPKDRCEIRLEFSVGGEKYTVIRTFKKGKTVQHDAEFYHNGRQRAKGVGPVETEVRRTLGMGPVDFKNTIYSGQKDLLNLLESTPGKRKEWFLKALGIDYLNTESQKILKERADKANDALQLLQGEYKGLCEGMDSEELCRLETEIEVTKGEITTWESRRVAHAKEKDRIECEIRDFNADKVEDARIKEKKNALIREMSDLKKQQGALQDRLVSLSAQVQEFERLKDEVAGFPEKRKEFDKLKESKNQVDKLVAEQQFVQRELADLSTRLKKNDEKITLLNREMEKLPIVRQEIRTILRIIGSVLDGQLENLAAGKIQEVSRSLGTFSARQERLEADKKKLESEWETLKTAGAEGICPLCRQKLGDHYATIEQEFADRLAIIKDEAVSILADQEKLIREKSVLDGISAKLKVLRECGEAQKNQNLLEKEQEDLKSSIQRKEKTIRDIEETIANLHFDPAEFALSEKKIATLERVQSRYNELGWQIAKASEVQAQLTAIVTRIASNESQQKEIDSDLVRSTFNPEKGPRLQRELEQILEGHREASACIARETEHVRHTEEKICRIRSDEKKKRDLERCITAAAEEIDLLNLTRKIISDYVIYLMQVVRSRIQEEVSRIVSEITGGRYEHVLLDDDFNLLIRDVDDDYAIDRFSGGEQDDIAVALRIALSRYLAELHNVHESTLLIFDEIFGSQDEERRNNLITALRTQESRFPQILLISHIPEMQGEFENTISVEMGADLASQIRMVD